MRKITLTLFLLSFLFFFTGSLRAQAPSIDWQKCYGGPYLDDPNAIEPTSDGGYIMIGYTWGPGGDISGFHGNHEVGDYWVVKLDHFGGVQWSRCLGGTFDDIGSVIHQTPDGGYVVGGESATLPGDGDVTTTNHGGLDYWIVKLDASGAIQWQYSYGGENNEYLYGLEFAPDGGYILAGQTLSKGGDVSGNHGGLDFWVVKINSAGVMQWQKCLGGSKDDEAYGVQVLADGSSIVAGYTASNDGDVSGNHGQSDMWVVKLDPSGNLLWSKCLGGSLREVAYGLQKTPDGGCIVAGYADSQDGDVTGNHGMSPGWSDMWAVKLDAGGNLQWEQCYGSSYNEIAYSIAATPDGGFLLAGSTDCLDNDQQVTCFNGYQDAWVIKISSTGVLQWQKTLGGTQFDEAHSVKTTPDGGSVVAIYTDSKELPGYHPDASSSVGDMYVVKLSAALTSPGIPTLAITPPPAGICSGSALTLQTTGTNISAGATYRWTRNGANVGTNAATYTASDFANGDQVSCTVTTTGNCNVIATATSNAIILNISPLTLPVIRIAAGATSVCAGSPLQFTAVVTNGHGAPIYQWEVNGSPAGTNSAVYSNNALQNGDIVTCVYSDNTACVFPGPDQSNAIPVQVDPSVTPTVTIAASSVSVCAGSSIVFMATPVNGGANPVFLWQLNGGNVGTNAATYSGSGFANGDVVSCVLQSNAVCVTPPTASSNAIALTVTSMTASSVSLDYSPAEICSGKNVQFTASPAGGGTAPVYQWQVNGMNAGSNSPSWSSNSLSDGDIVSCHLSDPVGCILPSSAGVTLTIYPSPSVTTGQSVNLSKGQGYELDLSPVGDIISYVWSPATGLSDPAIPDPVASPLKTTTYTLLVTTAEGCTATGNITVSVFSKLSIPNAFTPNGDGKNDIFYVMGGPIGSLIKDFAVFNRWGAAVFQVHDVLPDDPHFGWNGMVGGSLAPSGTYVYEIRIGLSDGSQKIYKGTVVLVR
jgi:gliding motility-associated-like protein